MLNLVLMLSIIFIPILIIISNILTYKMAKLEGLVSSVKDLFIHNMEVSIFFWKAIFGYVSVKNKKILFINRFIFILFILVELTLILLFYFAR